MAERRFDNKSVLVTGSASGFGRAAAARLAREGAKLVLCDRDAAGLDASAAACRDFGAPVVCHTGDVGEEVCARALVELAVAHFGRLDCALNNAGIAHRMSKLPDVELAEAERVLRVNLMGVFLALKYQLPQMQKQGGGAVLNVASVAGLVGAPLMSVYAASKHGVIGLTKSAALEYAKAGIRVNAICPAFAATSMVEGLVEGLGKQADGVMERMLANMPMKRKGTADEIVAAMLWMLSDENSFMTGQAVAFDGGLSAG